jgi:hypothetical protein
MKTLMFQVLTTFVIYTVHDLCLNFSNTGCRTCGSNLLRRTSAYERDRQPRHTRAVTAGNCEYYRGADKSLARPGRKQANVFFQKALISFGFLPCRKKNSMTARVSMLLKSRASLTCYRACFLPGRAKDLSAPGKLSSNYYYANLCLMVTEIKHQVVKAQRGGTVESALTTVLSARWGKEKSVP